MLLKKEKQAVFNTDGEKGGTINMSILAGSKIIIVGDRDGIPGPAIEECVKTAGGEVVFSSTECFV